MKAKSLILLKRRDDRRSSALLITLLMLSLITIIAVAFLGTMTWEISESRRSYENQSARALAMLGMNTAVAQLRQALDTWDNPYYNFATNPPTSYWSVSPGIISRWSYTSATPVTNYPLFSIDPNGATDLINLNAAQSDGTCPIAGITNTTVAGATPPNISVYWVNVLNNPANPAASATNSIVGRYAYWVDDENAKININTADGTMKYQTNSLGLGSPSEVSLQALQQNGLSLGTNAATNIVYLARTAGFNSTKEILRASGTTTDLYTNNVFNLTVYSRSPDLNIFGQPKMVMTPILGDVDGFATDMTMNSITLQAAKEIYPTPSQLPPYYVVNLVGNPYWTWYPASPPAPVPEPWPLAMRGEGAPKSTGNGISLSPGDANGGYVVPNYPWINGLMLANYLAGTNAAGQAINWPAFPGSSSTGFAGKYTPRQIDSLVAQILSLGSKDISQDYPFGTYDGWASMQYSYPWYYRGLRNLTVPFLFKGWLSNQWVSGMGRTPKVDAMELAFTTYGSVGSIGSPGPDQFVNYTPPSATLDIWQEWWLPAAYLGGSNNFPGGAGGGAINYGTQMDRGVLNTPDLTQFNGYDPNRPSAPAYSYPGAALPKADGFSTNYWGNQLLTNNQGIDFQANPSTLDDPDQASAALYHPKQYNLNGDGQYAGSGDGGTGSSAFSTPFSIVPIQADSPAWDWAPGEMRCVQSLNGGILQMPMQTNAGSPDNPTLTIGGGIQVRAELASSCISDPDPVPLDAVRGNCNPSSNPAAGYGSPWAGYVAYGLLDYEPWTDPAHISSAPTMTVRDRFMQAVIPVNFTMSIPTNSLIPNAPGDTEYVLATVFDPLVNKFPGDWTVTYGTTTPSVPSYWASATTSTPATNSENSSGFDVKLGSTVNGIRGDPDSYWMPQADCGISYIGDIAGQTLIPRSARFPNIGYLQYLRTGIIPDNETVDLPSQHGTPFRLLSYAPSTEAANQQTTLGSSRPYPDWALLDLLYVPSMLASYRSPYGYYETNSVWQGYGNPGVLANYSTGGGSTPGRINPNGAVIYTTNANMPQPGVARIIPLQALMQGLWVNQTLNTANLPSPTPGFTGGTAVDTTNSESDSSSIPIAIETYLRANGPMRMPEEICNIPAVATLRASVNATRNDLVRQIVGNLTTQSNTFSVWVAGETISKSKANTLSLTENDPLWGQYQTGDQVSASVRYHFVVERFLDPGADGVYGNSVNAGTDGIVGTYDDPVDPINHPFQPRYLYRVVSAEEIR